MSFHHSLDSSSTQQSPSAGSVGRHEFSDSRAFSAEESTRCLTYYGVCKPPPTVLNALDGNSLSSSTDSGFRCHPRLGALSASGTFSKRVNSRPWIFAGSNNSCNVISEVTKDEGAGGSICPVKEYHSNPALASAGARSRRPVFGPAPARPSEHLRLRACHSNASGSSCMATAGGSSYGDDGSTSAIMPEGSPLWLKDRLLNRLYFNFGGPPSRDLQAPLSSRPVSVSECIATTDRRAYRQSLFTRFASTGEDFCGTTLRGARQRWAALRQMESADEPFKSTTSMTARRSRYGYGDRSVGGSSSSAGDCDVPGAGMKADDLPSYRHDCTMSRQYTPKYAPALMRRQSELALLVNSCPELRHQKLRLKSDDDGVFEPSAPTDNVTDRSLTHTAQTRRTIVRASTLVDQHERQPHIFNAPDNAGSHGAVAAGGTSARLGMLRSTVLASGAGEAGLKLLDRCSKPVQRICSELSLTLDGAAAHFSATTSSARGSLDSIHKQAEAAEEADYPQYGVIGPAKDKKSKRQAAQQQGDASMAYGAQLHHYQQTKQKIINMEQSGGAAGAGGAGAHESDDSDAEGDDEGDYSVYECPGLAPTGDIEVANPLFVDGGDADEKKAADDAKDAPPTHHD